MYKRVFLFLALFIQITSLYSMEPEVDAVPADQRAAPVAAEQPQPAKSDKKECLPGLFSNSALVPSLCFLAARQLFLKEERALELYCATDAPELRELIKNVPFHMKEYLRKYFAYRQMMFVLCQILFDAMTACQRLIDRCLDIMFQ